MEPYYAYLRMINGDEVLGLITNEDSIEITIDRPVFIIRKKVNDKEYDAIMLFVTWIPIQFTNAKEVTVGKDKVLFSLELDEDTKDLIKRYSEGGYSKEIARPVQVNDTNETKQPISVDPFDALEGLLDSKKKE